MTKIEIIKKLKEVRDVLSQNEDNLISVKQCAETLLELLEKDTEYLIQERDNIVHGADKLLQIHGADKTYIIEQVDKFIRKDLNDVIFFTENK